MPIGGIESPSYEFLVKDLTIELLLYERYEIFD